MKKTEILFAVADGMGNIFEKLPVVSTLEKHKNWDLSFLICTPSPLSSDVLGKPVYFLKDTDYKDIKHFKGIIASGKAWSRIKKKFQFKDIKRLEKKLKNKPEDQFLKKKKTWEESEVRWRLKIAENFNIPVNGFDFSYKLCYSNNVPQYDVVICDGYNRKGSVYDNWHIKSYPHWHRVAEELTKKGYSVCSVGVKGEHVKNTSDETGRVLKDSLGIVAGAKVFLSNDTGLYHASALMNIPSVIVFTFTSVLKNYEPKFHRTAKIIQNDLKCTADCYKKRKHLWCENKRCIKINYKKVLNKALKTLEGK